ncbi:MAG: iron ABC transporter permease [Synoicihabitans sp.]
MNLAERQRWAMPAALGLLLFGFVTSLMVGDLAMSPAMLWGGLIHADELAATVLWNIRLPRTVVAMEIGAALAASGVVMQAFFRNHLASPGLLGVSAGGAAGAVVAIGLGWAAWSYFTVPLVAIVGAVGATIAVVVLAKQGASTERLLLAGIALNALLGAVTSYVLSNFTLSYERNAQIIFWLLGGLEDRTWEHVCMAAPIVVAALLLWPMGRSMDLLSLGQSEAQSLGVNVRTVRWRMLILATIMTALATAVAGMVGFIGLVVPHIFRLLFGPEHRRLVPVSLIGGAAFVLFCDVIARSAGNIRLGIITALVGGPFFLWMLRRES